MEKRYVYTEKIVTLYIAIMFLIYPLYYNNYYYDIVTCRFYLFAIMTGITVLLCLFAYCIERGSSVSEEKSLALNKTDYIVLALWVVNLISALLSKNMQIAIVGTSGRSSGLITITCYAAIYFIITRFYVLNIGIYWLLCISSILVSVIGSLQFLDIDFLGFYNGLNTGQKAMYFTTMGHANVVASFYGLVLPMVMVLYVNSEKWKELIFYGFTLVISFTGLFATGCESGAIITGAMVLAGLIAIQDMRKQYRIFMALPVMLLICKMLLVANDKSSSPRTLETFQSMIHSNKVFMILFLSLLLITMLSYFMYQKSGNKDGITGICSNKKYVKVILILVFSVIVLFIAGMVFFSTIGKDIKLGKLENMLRFNKRFGSYRGYIWGLTVNEFGKLPFIQKVFGVGCDTLRPFLMEFHQNDMYMTTGTYYDNAHNEFLQYLITTGILGLALYIILLIQKFHQGIKRMITENRLLTAAAVFGAIGYLFQSVVDINQCVTTPLFVIMICMIGCKEKDRTAN